jgi:hypothetical protein
MAIGTTAVFNPDISELFEEAFELCGKEIRSGNDIRTARRTLNYLTLEWANEGLNLWTVEEVSIADTVIVAGTHTYDLPQDTISILDAVIRTDDGDAALQSDITIDRISWTDYSSIPAKLQSGRPVQYVHNRVSVTDVQAGVDRPSTVTFWPVPDLSSTYTFVYWRMRRMADATGSLDDTMEIPERFLPAFVYGLASRLAIKIAPERAQMLKIEYTTLFQTATEEDRIKQSLHITPDLTGY